MGQILINSERVDVDFATKREVFKWPARSADRALKGIVLHETAGTTASGAIGTWRGYAGKGIGAHFIIDVDGTVIVCADIRRDAPWHAGTWSHDRIGIEVVCPVTDLCPYPPSVGDPWKEPWRSAPREDSVYVVGGKYVPPFVPQLEAMAKLVKAIKENVPEFEDLKPVDITLPRLTGANPALPGIVAHAQVDRSRTDGWGPLQFLAGWDAFSAAYEAGR